MKRWHGKPTLTGPPTPPEGWWNSEPLSPPWCVEGVIECDSFLEQVQHSFKSREEAIAFIDSIPLRPTDSPTVGGKHELTKSDLRLLAMKFRKTREIIAKEGAQVPLADNPLLTSISREKFKKGGTMAKKSKGKGGGKKKGC